MSLSHFSMDPLSLLSCFVFLIFCTNFFQLDNGHAVTISLEGVHSSFVLIACLHFGQFRSVNVSSLLFFFSNMITATNIAWSDKEW